MQTCLVPWSRQQPGRIWVPCRLRKESLLLLVQRFAAREKQRSRNYRGQRMPNSSRPARLAPPALLVNTMSYFFLLAAGALLTSAISLHASHRCTIKERYRERLDSVRSMLSRDGIFSLVACAWRQLCGLMSLYGRHPSSNMLQQCSGVRRYSCNLCQILA
jgi:hypothetical protein